MSPPPLLGVSAAAYCRRRRARGACSLLLNNLPPPPRTSSTLCAVRAEVSRKMRPCSFANCSPSSVDTARRCCGGGGAGVRARGGQRRGVEGGEWQRELPARCCRCRRRAAAANAALPPPPLPSSRRRRCPPLRALHLPPLPHPPPLGPPTGCLTERSDLLPISMIVMLGLACCRASSSQLARWLKVSRLEGGGAGAGAEARPSARRCGHDAAAAALAPPAAASLATVSRNQSHCRCRRRAASGCPLPTVTTPPPAPPLDPSPAAPRDVIHQQRARRAPVVGPRDRPERLLARLGAGTGGRDGHGPQGLQGAAPPRHARARAASAPGLPPPAAQPPAPTAAPCPRSAA
jgi:hypothetical protein